MPPLRDLKGQQFGYLVVLNKSPSVNKKVMWECQCECGNKKIISGSALVGGRTKSCGCYQRQKASETLKKTASNIFNDYTNQKIDFLTVIKKTENRSSNGSIIWECQCDCGNIVYKNTKDLRLKKACHCGCQNIHSQGEKQINEILTKHNIFFIQQHWFNDCRYPSNHPARFDFFVNNNYIIEFDGEQHYIPVEQWGGEEHLKYTQEHDIIKNEYCKKNNIPLIRIPYTELNKITLEMLQPETSEYLITG